MPVGRRRRARRASVTIVAALVATFAFSVPAYAQEGPGTGDTPTESTEPGTETPPGDDSGTTETGSTGENTDPPADPAPTTDPPTTDPPATESESPPATTEPPAEGSTDEAAGEPSEPSEPAAPSQTCAPPEEGATDGASSACEPAAPSESEADPAGEPDCDAEASPAQPASEGDEPATSCQPVAEPGPAAATAPPPPPPAPAPAPVAAPAAAETAPIVLIVAEPAAPAAAPSTPQNADLANRLLPLLVATVTMSDSTVELAMPATISDEPADGAASERSFAASLYESVALAERRSRGSCAQELTSSGACAGSSVESVLTTPVQLYPTMDEKTTLPAIVARAEELKRQRRTHAETRADAAQPAVAVAAAAPSRSDSRTGVSGGSSGGSAGSATQRIFVVSTLPLTLSAPVSFPTEPAPTLLPEGEPGIAPPASPG